MSVRTAGFPTDGLVAAYLMNGTARDSSGRGHHASTSRVAKTANRFDTPRKALYFNGVDSVLTIPNHRDFSVKHDRLPVHLRMGAARGDDAEP
jgi:hypothetical protein